MKRRTVAAVTPPAPVVRVPVAPVSVSAKLAAKAERARHDREMSVARIKSTLETLAANAAHALARLNALAERETIVERSGAEPVPFDGERKAHAIADNARYAFDGIMHRATSLVEEQRNLTETLRRIDLLEGLEEHAVAVAVAACVAPTTAEVAQ